MTRKGKSKGTPFAYYYTGRKVGKGKGKKKERKKNK